MVRSLAFPQSEIVLLLCHSVSWLYAALVLIHALALAQELELG